MSALDGQVNVQLDANADFSDAVGIYRCHLIVNDPPNQDYSPYAFDMEIFECLIEMHGDVFVHGSTSQINRIMKRKNCKRKTLFSAFSFGN